eukprot:366023-Chlamydomonas_euryale.AAC.3
MVQKSLGQRARARIRRRPRGGSRGLAVRAVDPAVPEAGVAARRPQRACAGCGADGRPLARAAVTHQAGDAHDAQPGAGAARGHTCATREKGGGCDGGGDGGGGRVGGGGGSVGGGGGGGGGDGEGGGAGGGAGAGAGGSNGGGCGGGGGDGGGGGGRGGCGCACIMLNPVHAGLGALLAGTPGVCSQGLQSGFAVRVRSQGLQSRFAVRVCSQGLQSGFAVRVCSQGLQSRFAVRVCSQGLQSGFAVRVCSQGMYACGLYVCGLMSNAGEQVSRLHQRSYWRGPLLSLCAASSSGCVRSLQCTAPAPSVLHSCPHNTYLCTPRPLTPCLHTPSLNPYLNTPHPCPHSPGAPLQGLGAAQRPVDGHGRHNPPHHHGRLVDGHTAARAGHAVQGARGRGRAAAAAGAGAVRRLCAQPAHVPRRGACKAVHVHWRGRPKGTLN